MQMSKPAWYCARTKSKHEHIAAANVQKNLGLEVFHPRLRIDRVTRRGPMRVTEPLFPGYLFIRCVMGEKIDEIRYANGISSIVQFADRIPTVPDQVIDELQACFPAGEPMIVTDTLSPGVEVLVAEGAFAGMRASVLRIMPAKRRVQILLDVLGGPTAVEVDRNLVVSETNMMADLLPLLAIPQPAMLRA
jgi:transcriptional antiterminator RfaH